MTPALPCVVCGRELKNIDTESDNQPYAGTAFSTSGHYGSTIFDPMDGSALEINLCDPCIRRLGDRQKIYIQQRAVRVVDHRGSQIGWAERAADRSYRAWEPTEERSEEAVHIRSWDEWVAKRDEYGLTSWFGDDKLEELFADRHPFLKLVSNGDG